MHDKNLFVKRFSTLTPKLDKRVIKKYILRFLNLLPITKNKKYCYILLYHSISEEDFYLCIKPQDFIRQIRFIKENFKIITPKDLKLWISEPKDQDQDAVILTFDDGYKDNLTTLLPILEEYKIKVSIFVAPFFKTPRLDILTKEELKQLSRSELIEFGSHTLSHPILTDFSDIKSLQKEIKTSKLFLEDLLQKKVEYFSYPKGRYNKLIKDIVVESGYLLAFGIWPQCPLVSNNKKIDLYALPRIYIGRHNTDLVYFKLYLSKGIDKFSKLTSFLHALHTKC